MADVGMLGGGESHAFAINNRGQVVGWSLTASGDYHAFLWERGTMTDLGTLPGGSFGEAVAINNRGQIVGRSDVRRRSSSETSALRGSRTCRISRTASIPFLPLLMAYDLQWRSNLEQRKATAQVHGVIAVDLLEIHDVLEVPAHPSIPRLKLAIAMCWAGHSSSSGAIPHGVNSFCGMPRTLRIRPAMKSPRSSNVSGFW